MFIFPVAEFEGFKDFDRVKEFDREVMVVQNTVQDFKKYHIHH